MKEEVSIQTEYIQLGQFLKLVNIVESGGMVKHFLSEYQIYVNGTLENRRGRKLYPGDVIDCKESGSFTITAE
ncbi:S4 domain-containing protein YaaA [Terrihalobacillus insolitus]|uniref:S4 domain-containing protein YaaA n=1 Tax=Terrihalobacillus insolitus TaxID=2950438 RepID=UPI0023422ADD|nr:S4 domain-containing protein YaaA [Terrihalobacillus insolitus]MDC3414907.1 S4 domain-containing protein YaaA [Terrihalobacillus insolitus]